MPDSDLTIHSLLEIVEKELTARERTLDRNQTFLDHTQGKSRPTATTLLSGIQHHSTGPVCCYCQQSHSSNKCSSVTAVSSCKQILRTSGRCFNCLRKGHLSHECRSTTSVTQASARDYPTSRHTPQSINQVQLRQLLFSQHYST